MNLPGAKRGRTQQKKPERRSKRTVQAAAGLLKHPIPATRQQTHVRRPGRQADRADDLVPSRVDPVQVPDRSTTCRVPHQDVQAVLVTVETSRIAGRLQSRVELSHSVLACLRQRRQRRWQFRKRLQAPTLAHEFLNEHRRRVAEGKHGRRTTTRGREVPQRHSRRITLTREARPGPPLAKRPLEGIRPVIKSKLGILSVGFARA